MQPSDNICFWCDKVLLKKKDRTKDHLIPKGMGGANQTIVCACDNCNNERGKITELYNLRLHLIRNMNKHPEKITKYKNRFKKKVFRLSKLIIKWEMLHREKGVFLPFSILEACKLDDIMPIVLGEPMKEIYYRQCTVTRKNETQVTWLPEQYAVLKKVLKLRNYKDEWEDGWVVEGVSATKIAENKLPDSHKEIKDHRKATGDIS